MRSSIYIKLAGLFSCFFIAVVVLAANNVPNLTTDQLHISGATATTVPYFDANKKVISSAVTPTELGYVSGTTSSIQTQLNNTTKKDLSNLIATAVNQALMPNTDATFDIGSTPLRWKNIYLSDSLFLGDAVNGVRGYVQLLPTGFNGGVVRLGYNGAWGEIAYDGAFEGIDAFGYQEFLFQNHGTPLYRFYGSANTPIFQLDDNHLSFPITDFATGGILINSAAGAITTTAGPLPVNTGGTGQTSYTNGQLLIGNTSGNTLTKATLTAGTNVTITNGNGSISIAASAGSAPVYSYVAQSSTLNPAVIGSFYNLSGASFNITLPTAASIAGQTFVFKHNGTNLTQVYTFLTTSAQTIDGVASGSYALYTNGETLTLASDGANWQVVNHKTDTGVISAGSSIFSASTAYVFSWTGNQSIIAGDTYTDGAGNTFTVTTTANTTSGTFSGTPGTPATTGTLTRATGTGISAVTWTSRTITGQPTWGTGGVNTLEYWREGIWATVRMVLTNTVAGTNGSGFYIFNLPAGLSALSTYSVYTSTTSSQGAVTAVPANLMSLGGFAEIPGVALLLNSTIGVTMYSHNQVRFYFVLYNTSTALSSAGGEWSSSILGMASANETVHIIYKVPIQGWQP